MLWVRRVGGWLINAFVDVESWALCGTGEECRTGSCKGRFARLEVNKKKVQYPNTRTRISSSDHRVRYSSGAEREGSLVTWPSAKRVHCPTASGNLGEPEKPRKFAIHY
jgi:hypothetical protein